MNREEFIKFIESIGFKYEGNLVYLYGKYTIGLLSDTYSLYNVYKLIGRSNCNDLILLEKEFKLELRSIKLKQLLG